MARRSGLPVPLARVGALAVGVGAWTFTEYVAHRWLMHGGRRFGVISREHVAHHVDPEATDPRLRALGYAAVVTPSLAGASLAGAWPIGVGWAAGYVAYEQFHWREHHRRPLGRWEREARRRHFAHHFGAPRTNYGVTTSVWDRVFGTYRPTGTVKVPRRHAMPWLLDERGVVAAPYRSDYELVGVSSATRREDAWRAVSAEPGQPDQRECPKR